MFKILNLDEYKRWLARKGKRAKTIYAWIKRLEKLNEANIDITNPKMVNKWLDYNYPKKRNSNEASYGSTYQLVASIRSYLKFLGRPDLAKLIEYPSGKMPRRIKTLTDEQIKSMLEAVEKLKPKKVRDTARLILYLLIETGMRRGELCNIKPNWISWSENKITVPKEVAKGKMDRDVFFSDTTKQLLIDYIKNYRIKNNEKIFRWGEKVADNMVTYYVKKIAKIANLPNWITPHIFRHTFASRLVKKNVNLRIIQTLLGHCNIASTEIYTHIEKEKIKEEAQKAFLEQRMKGDITI